MALDTVARGLAAYANTSRGIAAAGASLTSRPKLLHFRKALYAGMTATGGPPTVVTRPTTNLVNVGVFGDSVGDGIPQFLNRRMVRSLGTGGGFYGNIILAGGATQGGSITDGAYWVSGSWSVLPSGGSVEYKQNGGRPRCDTIKIYYVKRPGAGTFKVQIDSGSGYADEAGYTAVDASNATVTAGVITITKATGSYSVKLVNVSGTCEGIRAAYLDTTNGGLVTYRFDVGGLPLKTMTSTALAIRNVVFNDLAMDMAYMEFKDPPADDFTNQFPAFMNDYIAGVTKPCDWVFLGSSPEAIELTTGSDTPKNNRLQEAYAAANGFTYVDGYSIFKDYPSLLALGLQGDGTHIATAGQAIRAEVAWSQLGFNDLMEIPSDRPVRLDTGATLYAAPSASIVFEGSTAYFTNTVRTDGFDMIFQGARSWSIRNAAGAWSAAIGTGNSLGQVTANIFAFADLSASQTGLSNAPCIRKLGTTDTSGVYISGVSPGNGSSVGPLMASEIRIGTSSASTLKWTSGTGSPEGVVTAAIGSLYSRTDGGASTSLYVKESGAGNTGWVAK